MKLLIILVASLCMLCSCSSFYGTQAVGDQEVHTPKPLTVPVGKNWQITEEAPALSNDSGRLPFQTEQSVQPEGTAKPDVPGGSRTIDTAR